MKRFVILAGIVTTFVLGFGTSALACSCDYSPNPPCRAYGQTPFIFDGVVEKFEDLGPNRRRATFNAITFYKGSQTGSVVINTGDGGSDCGYPFEVGKRYIVYAYGEDELSTSYCTRTRPFEYATEDLKYFKIRPSLKDGGIIFGSVKKFALGYGYEEDYGITSPVRGVPIVLNGPRSVTLRTNDSGEFQVAGFPAGDYLIEARLPKTLRLSPNTRTMQIDVLKLEDRGCVGAKFYVDFEGEIQGKVLDDSGRGAKGFDVTLVSADYKFEGRNDTGPLLEWTVSRQDGTYVLDGIPPGRYRLGIGIGGAFDSFGKNGQIFYPNTKDPNKSTIITIGVRSKLRNINLQIPKTAR